MSRRTPKIPLDLEMGVTLINLGQESCQNYAKKLQARLKWAYQKAQETVEKNLKDKRGIMTKKMKYMSLKPEDIVLVCAKVPPGQHKIVDQWEDEQHQVLSQIDDQPVFRVQPENAIGDENISLT